MLEKFLAIKISRKCFLEFKKQTMKLTEENVYSKNRKNKK